MLYVSRSYALAWIAVEQARDPVRDRLMELRDTSNPDKCTCFATLILNSTAFVFWALVVQVEHKRDTNSPNSSNNPRYEEQV